MWLVHIQDHDGCTARGPAAFSRSVWVGDVLLDKFVVERPAASGGMGSVYRALDRETGAPVAVKVMDGEPRGAERFFREARLLAELEHTAIVRYFADGVTEEGEPFLVMEWLSGVTLAEHLEGGRLSVSDTLSIARRAGEGLAAAHARGIVHRDVKPSNLFLVEADAARTKLLDFGIARRVAATHALTGTGVIVGTVGYMAPEQARGESEVDARADVFALGCVLFECLAGRPAFAGRQLVAVLAKLVLEEVPPLSELRSDVSVALSELVATMLAKDRQQRPADGAAVLREIRALSELHDRTPGRADDAQQVRAHQQPCALTDNEQRVLSVILIDARTESAALAPTVPPVTRALDPLSSVLQHFGAEPVRMADGSALAILTARGSAKDQASRGAACALAISSALPGARIALATGRAETKRLLPVGTAIDRAAELLAASSARSFEGVRIDEVTRALLDARFEVAMREDGAVLIADRGESDEVPLLLGKRIPCVGRDKELTLLEATLSECVEEPAARAVLVTASAGMGKTRLRQAFLVRTAERVPDLLVLQARGDPFAAGSAHTLARQLVRRAGGLREGEPASEQRAKLRAMSARCFAGEALGRVSDFLGEIVGVPPERGDGDGPSPQFRAARNDPRIMRAWLARSFEEWLTAECARHPTLIVLEDLHWGDATTVGYLAQALHDCRALPLMVLALARPEVAEEFPNLWPEASRHDIALPRLTRRAAAELVRAALGGAPADETVARLVERSDGNAFYLEELVRARAAGVTDLPETVIAMVEARLEALEPNARRMLRAASVFGEVFWRGAVSSLVASATDETADVLEALVARELVLRSRTDKFPGETEYAFRHGLIRETAYAMLTDEDRQTGHRLAGEWLERAGEKDARVLADHFELGGVPERAVLWLLHAAQHATEGGDIEAALALARRAVAGGAEGETLGRLELSIGVNETWRGHPDEGIRWLRRALAHLPEGSEEWVRVAAGYFVAGMMTGDPAPTIEILPRLLALSPMPVASGPYGNAVHFSVLALLNVGQKDPARALLEKCERVGAADREKDPAFAFWLTLSRHLIDVCVRDSLALMVRNTRQAVRLGTVVRRDNDIYARFCLGGALGNMGAFDDAAAELRAALDYAERGGEAFRSSRHRSVPLVDSIRQGIAWIQVAQGRGAEAMALLTELSRSHVAMLRGLAGSNLAEAHRQAGSLVDAEREARRAVDEAALLPLVQTGALAALGRVLLDQERPREALDVADRGLRLCEATGWPSVRSILHRVRAEALWVLGEHEAARAAVRVARERILRIADELDEPELRRSWLENPVDNVRTLELAAEWGAERPE